MCDNNKRKRKRTKLECLSCGRSFDHDYRRKHEIKIHGGDHVKVKDISLGIANNPFIATRLNYQRKTQHSNQANSSTVSPDVEEQNDLDIVSTNTIDHPDQSITSESLMVSSDVIELNNDLVIASVNTLDLKFENAESKIENSREQLENNQSTAEIGEQDMSHIPSTDYTWVDCVGQFSALLCMLNECNNLLAKVTNVSIPNHISFLTESISMISSIKEKSNEFINMATSVLTSELSLGQNNENNIIDKLLDHDPGKREKVQSSSQRNYLLSLGPFQPKKITKISYQHQYFPRKTTAV